MIKIETKIKKNAKVLQQINDKLLVLAKNKDEINHYYNYVINESIRLKLIFSNTGHDKMVKSPIS